MRARPGRARRPCAPGARAWGRSAPRSPSTTPQWPWEVYSQRQTSVMTQNVGGGCRRLGSLASLVLDGLPGAAGTEIKALQDRNSYLATKVNDDGCSAPSQTTTARAAPMPAPAYAPPANAYRPCACSYVRRTRLCARPSLCAPDTPPVYAPQVASPSATVPAYAPPAIARAYAPPPVGAYRPRFHMWSTPWRPGSLRPHRYHPEAIRPHRPLHHRPRTGCRSGSFHGRPNTGVDGATSSATWLERGRGDRQLRRRWHRPCQGHVIGRIRLREAALVIASSMAAR